MTGKNTDATGAAGGLPPAPLAGTINWGHVQGHDGVTTLFAGPGEVRSLARALDWAATPLGPVTGWPPALRTAVRLVLSSPVAMSLWCGDAYTLLYNDAYRRVLGAKHPQALGRPGGDVFAELWPAIRPQFEAVRAGGPPVDLRDVAFRLARLDGGGLEDAWFDYALSAVHEEPAPDDAGAVLAVLSVVTETTARVRAQARTGDERARLAAVFEQSPSFLAVLRGPENVFELVNDAYYRIVGHRDLLGKPLFEALPEMRGQGFDGYLGRVRETGEPLVFHDLPVLLERTPGAPLEERFIDITYLPLVEADGARDAVIAHGTDVTDAVQARREAARLLAESEAARAAAEAANSQLQDQQLEMELAHQQLQDSAAELEATNEELQAAATELEERTAQAERAQETAAAATRRVAFLADASERLAASLDYETTLRQIVALAVPTVADWAAYNVDAGDGTIRTVAIHHPDPAMEALAHEIGGRYPIRADDAAGVARVLRTGEPELIPEVPDAVLEAVAYDAEHLQMLRGIGFRSLMNVPVIAQGRVLGALGFGTGESSRRFDADDLAVAQELARRAATAIDNARLYAEAKGARREAERERARAAGILDTMADMHFVLDAEFRFTSANVAMERGLGHTREQLIGRKIWEVFPGTVGTVFEESYRRVVADRVDVHFTGEYADGFLDIVPEVDAYPTADGGVAVFWRDIAPRRRAEAALRESERQFRTLADAIPTLAWTARADGYLDWYNARWYAYTGTTPEQMEGWGWQAAHDPAALPDIMARWQASIASGEPFEMTLPLRGADGRFRRFVTRVMPVHDAGGRVLRWFGTNTDVEAERAAREAAEQAAARTSLLQALTGAFSRTLTREDVAAVVADRVAAAFGAHLGVLALVTPEGDRLAVAAAERLRRGAWQAWQTFPLDAPVPLAEAARDARTVALPTFAAIAAHAPALAEMCREYGTEAMCVVPVIATGGQILGALGLSFPTARAFDPETLALLETLARQAAQALERAQLFEAAQAARADAEAAESRLRDVFEQAPVAVAVLTGPEHVYTVVSPPYAASPGGGRQLLGRTVREAFPEVAETGHIATMDRVYETGEPFSATERQVFLTRPGVGGADDVLEEHFFNIGYQPLRDGAGRVYAVASVAYDVTEQVRARRDVEAAREEAERQRIEAERQRVVAEAANAAKSQFLSTMSHELRTPLNAIGGYTELMTLGLRGPLTEPQQQDLGRIRMANQHLMSLVTDILNFARLDAGQIEFRLTDVELASIVADLEPLVGPQLVAKGIAFTHDGCASDTPDQPHLVRADPEKLRQILLNLLTNAVKFTEAGGRVALACETDADARVIRLHVTDTGRGIPQDQLERIFEPFVQVDRHRTHESQQGVGLGLAISRDLARGMGGDLTAESTLGMGSAFTLTLPMGSTHRA